MGCGKGSFGKAGSINANDSQWNMEFVSDGEAQFELDTPASAMMFDSRGMIIAFVSINFTIDSCAELNA